MYELSSTSFSFYFEVLLTHFFFCFCLLMMIFKLFKTLCMQACVNSPPLIFFSVLKYSLPISCCSSENIESVSGVNHQNKQNRFVPLSEGVTACAAHPLNGTIVVGTKVCSLEDLFHVLSIIHIVHMPLL